MTARIAAARALVAIGEAGGVAALGVKLAHPEEEIPEVLVECMDAITAIDGEAAMMVLASYLYNRSAYLAASAATALAGLPSRWHEPVISLLTKACVETVSDESRLSFVLALASMRSDAVTPALEELTEHYESNIRLTAVEGLKQRGDSASAAVLQEVATRAGDQAVVRAAQDALRELRFV
jgi:HEAT repeat protein